MWQHFSAYERCSQCKQRTIIPADSPKGSEFREQSSRAAVESSDRDKRECPYCAELILKKARVCKHCGKEVEPDKDTVEPNTEIEGPTKMPGRS